MYVRIFSTLVAGSLIVTAGALGLMASQRAVPIEVKSRTLISAAVKAGGELEWTVTVVQHRRCYVHSDRVIYDSRDTRFLLEPIEFQAGIGEVGIEQEYTIRIPLPEDLAPGPARYEASTVYRCNMLHWLWPIYSPYAPIYFEVVP